MREIGPRAFLKCVGREGVNDAETKVLKRVVRFCCDGEFKDHMFFY